MVVPAAVPPAAATTKPTEAGAAAIKPIEAIPPVATIAPPTTAMFLVMRNPVSQLLALWMALKLAAALRLAPRWPSN